LPPDYSEEGIVFEQSTPEGKGNQNFMNKRVKRTSHEKARKPIDETTKGGQPAQEIAEDEVEIAETGGKPGSGSQPIGTQDPKKKA
jgi:hypothetical protein